MHSYVWMDLYERKANQHQLVCEAPHMKGMSVLADEVRCYWACQVFEALNFKTHLILRGLRSRGTRQRGIPYGAGFDYISCANYYWETLAWLVFAILVSCFTGKFCRVYVSAIRKLRTVCTQSEFCHVFRKTSLK